jgi:hypothetical protein
MAAMTTTVALLLLHASLVLWHGSGGRTSGQQLQAGASLRASSVHFSLVSKAGLCLRACQHHE